MKNRESEACLPLVNLIIMASLQQSYKHLSKCITSLWTACCLHRWRQQTVHTHVIHFDVRVYKKMFVQLILHWKLNDSKISCCLDSSAALIGPSFYILTGVQCNMRVSILVHAPRRAYAFCTLVWDPSPHESLPCYWYSHSFAKFHLWAIAILYAHFTYLAS